MLKKILSLTLLFLVFNVKSQNVQLSVFSEVSIITSGPGDNLYEKFGHTAIRVKDPVLNLDLLYNYGIFDFDAPNFYLNFTKGFMKYKLASYPFHYSLKSANEDKRWVKQQVLNLTQEEKTAIFYFLQSNAQPENASYFYDPFFNNCATKPRDIIQKILGDKLIIKDNLFKEKKSFRQLMNQEINMSTWGSFGINIALGSKLDKITSPEERMYLPDYVFEVLASAKILREGNEVNLVKNTKILLDFEEKQSKSDLLSPFLTFLILMIIGGFITYKDYTNNKRTRWLDVSLFFITGLIGSLILFLWFFTNHSTAPNNFNFLWAFAPNLIVSFFLTKRNLKSWVFKYVLFLMLLLTVIPFVWVSGIQLFTWQLIPFWNLLLLRYWYLFKLKSFE
ncbi:DUF4105 domain-containing protein [Tenacibaculum sp. IB213877]|uniref:lipoprotein N-acyltransferase Lnb domain-containing protein n=1 Tax=Tenacibaculum sp. IB213877 TaxID=3097351 RepID=UPI002A5AF6C6|nr:DUF4105 domain-containing protein [Tenacibaculum sp. IB213877]MDY0779616.1 DUF4105 domain-containing protein [Tenacibaculum sp. IB213877]